MDKLIGFFSGIGFLGGMFLGAFLYPGMGIVGCLAAVACGAFCAVGFPAAICNPNEQGAKLVSSLTSPQTRSPKTFSDEATPLLVTEKVSCATAAPVEQLGMFNRLLSFFGWHRYTSANVATVENSRRDFSR